MDPKKLQLKKFYDDATLRETLQQTLFEFLDSEILTRAYRKENTNDLAEAKVVFKRFIDTLTSEFEEVEKPKETTELTSAE